MFISFLAYANAWPNVLIWDDAVFAMGNRLAGVTWTDIGDFFTQDVWASVGVDSGLYRPLLLTSVSLDILIFGEWKAGFHLVNILFHALSSIVVFGLIRHLLTANRVPSSHSNPAALLAAVVFAVHPVHTEVVNSVFNRSEMLVTLCVAGGAWWFLKAIERGHWKAWGVLAVIYLLALLSRETGVVLPAIVVLFLWFTTEGSWKTRVRRCLPVFILLIPLAFYFWLRANALGIQTSLDNVAVEATTGAAVNQTVPLLGLQFDIGKIPRAAAVWFDSLKLMVWPHPLMTYYDRSGTNVWFALAAQAALIAFSAYRAARDKPGLFFGLMFFYLTVLPTSRILGIDNINPHMHERYLYMPSVGIAVILAFGLARLLQKAAMKHVLIAVLSVTVIFTPLTWARNSKWVSTALLAETDIKQGGNHRLLLKAYASALIQEGDFRKAAAFCEDRFEYEKRHWPLAGYCGQAYARLRQYDKAEKAFAFAIDYGREQSTIHYALATMYLDQGRRQEAGEQFELAVTTERQAFLKEYIQAEALVRLYPSNFSRLQEARAHLEKSIELQPQFHHARKRLEEIDRRIEGLDQR